MALPAQPPAPPAAPVNEDGTPVEVVVDPYAERRSREKSDDYWEETFKTHTDKKPYGTAQSPARWPPSLTTVPDSVVGCRLTALVSSRCLGPESVGLDVMLVGVSHVYGLPERSTALNLPSTKYAKGVGGGAAIGRDAETPFRRLPPRARPHTLRRRGAGISSDPHRLYNLDVFEYDLDVPMALYGSIPFVVGHALDRSVGLLWLNGAETWIDVERSSEQAAPAVHMHWFSESGIIDVWGFAAKQPAQVLQKLTALTGTDSARACRTGQSAHVRRLAQSTIHLIHCLCLHRRPCHAARICAGVPPMPLELQ